MSDVKCYIPQLTQADPSISSLTQLRRETINFNPNQVPGFTFGKTEVSTGSDIGDRCIHEVHGSVNRWHITNFQLDQYLSLPGLGSTHTTIYLPILQSIKRSVFTTENNDPTS